GTFSVYMKAPQMRFRGVNPDGSHYDIPDVHWVMPFWGDYTIHGAYWRPRFGVPGSDGCVSMTDADAKLVYDWADVGTPVVIHSAGQNRNVAINGQGWAPGAATIDWFRSHGVSLIPPDGFLPATVPAQFASWCTALQQFGTASLADVLGPAVDLAEGGFPMYTAMHNGILKVAERFINEWPTSAALYLDNGRPAADGTLTRNPDWARTLKGAIDASLRASGDREASIQAAMDYFYTGPVAQKA